MDINKTESWWNRLCSDENQMNKWLQKLQVTEIDGFTSNIEDEAKFNTKHKDLVRRVMLKTADDEKRHSDLLVKILEDRGVGVLEDQTPTSLYWEKMQSGIVNLNTCLAVYHLGEKIASERFQFILKHERTPKDVLGFVKSAGPDETYHAKVYAMLAGPLAVSEMQKLHEEALALIMKGN